MRLTVQPFVHLYVRLCVRSYGRPSVGLHGRPYIRLYVRVMVRPEATTSIFVIDVDLSKTVVFVMQNK